MFERRLKIFLGILLGIMALLLVRAVQLQVFTRSTWAREAEDFKTRPVYVETVRGRILDHRGAVIAVDEACMDACVDYRAISRNGNWIARLATARLKEQLGDGFKRHSEKDRDRMIAAEAILVIRDIDAMFQLLAEVSGQELLDIEEVCHTINLKVAMRSRYVQYKRFQKAEDAHAGSGPPPWYRRWLVEGGEGGPCVDDFEQLSGEETDAHPVVRNISQDIYMRLAKETPRCPGLVLRQGTTRRYPYGRAGAHLLGIMTPVSKDDLLADPNLGDELRKYDFTDLIGRGGLEALAERALRGTRGKLFRRIVSSATAASAAVYDDEIVSAPASGGDVRSTIDIELQGEIQQMFARMKVPNNTDPDHLPPIEVAMHGAAVVIDITTGHVRALASYPDFDANTLSENYESLIRDPFKVAPLMNRATQAQLVPGSTIKPVVGISAITAGLNVPGHGVMTPTTGIECTGYLVIAGRKIKSGGRCWVASKFHDELHGAVAHHPVPWEHPHKGRFGNADGFLTFADSLERSCNVYFETCADAFGVNGLSTWFERFGLGHETGVGLPEGTGSLPRKMRMSYPSIAWFSGIGQTGVTATPIQMANVAATIARDGVWVRPRLVEDDRLPLSPAKMRDGPVQPDRSDLGLSKQALAAAREGMVRVVNGPAGTGKGARRSDMLVAGKTGTAEVQPISDVVLDENGQPKLDNDGNKVRQLRPIASATVSTDRPWYRGTGKTGTNLNHAWFIGYAPADEPQVAFCVMVEYGGTGGLAAKTAADILDRCIEHGYVKVKR
ncbi:MAG: penicillin-binding transpeptidase domain-containing protein [Tepidisphaeraceae bacterium]